VQNKAQAAHTFKIGATLVIPAQAQDDAGAGIDLTNITVKSQLRTPNGGMVAEMTVQWVDRTTGSYALWLPGTGTTDGYKVGEYALDVFYTEANAGFGGRPVVVATETLMIALVKAETQS
jgi:hypothetical protein